jgi:hypothetical protein
VTSKNNKMEESQILVELTEILKKEGYTDFKYIESKGLCAINRFMFTHGVLVNLSEIGYARRYCFHTYAEAKIALMLWDGTSEHISGNWIKCKGDCNDLSNPNYIQ